MTGLTLKIINNTNNAINAGLGGGVDKIIVPQASVDAPDEDLTSEGADTSTSHKESERPLEMGYIKDLWQMGEASSHFKMPELTKEIDAFVLEQIEREGFVKNHKSYEEIIQRYEKKLGLPDDVNIYTRTERVAELMRIDAKLYAALKEKEEFTKKDPMKMTSAELKRYMKGI